MAIQKFRVAGLAHIRDDETHQDVPPGQTVGLDPDIPGRNIEALLISGHIAPVEDKPAKKSE